MAQFKRSIQPIGFRPEEVSERNISELQNYSNRIIGALREERDAVITNRNEIANAMKENAQIEAQQASTNQQIQQQNVSSQLKAQQDISNRALEEYETKTKTTKALYTTVSDLSLTASKKLREIEIKKFEEKDKALAAEIYAMGDNHPTVKALKALKYDSYIEEITAKTEVAQARVQGADTLSADETLKQLNELGYTSKTAILRHIGRGWASYLRDQTISDKQYTDPTTGRTFTTKEAKEDQRLALILANEELAQYEKIHGIAGQLAALKQESGYLDDTFKVTQTFADAVGKQQHETFLQKYMEDYSFKLSTMNAAEASNFHEREWPTLVSLFGRKGALDFLTESHKKVDTEGNAVYNLAALEAARLGPNGETFGVYWAKNRVADIKLALVQGRSAINRVTEEEKQQNALNDYRSVRKALQAQLAAGSPQDDESIFATARKELADRNDGIVPKEFEDDYQANLKQNKIEAQNQSALVLEKIRTGRATPGDVQSIADPDLRQAVQAEYDKATKVRKFGEDYESTLKKIKDGAKQIMGDSLEGSGSFESFRLSLVMEKNFANDYAYALKVTKDPARALEVASNQLVKDINDAKANTNPASRYYSESGPNNEKVFTNIKNLQAKTAAQKAEADKKLTSVIAAKGINALTTPGLLGSESDLRSISEANKNNQLLRFTPQILKAAKLLGITELEATNQAIAAHNKVSPNKIPILTPDRNLQLVNNARPATRALFTNLPTRQSVLRGAAEITQTPLRDPSNIRANIVQYVTGQPSMKGVIRGQDGNAVIYDPRGHGGQNYHNHYQFNSVIERERVEKILRTTRDPWTGKPYRITSVQEGRGGTHGQGLSLDIAPPVTLPADQEEAWSAYLNKLLGYDPLRAN